MPELDNLNPELGASPELGAEPAQAHSAHDEAEHDREGAMAKADLYKLASYSHKLYKQLHDEDQLEAWVQAKITKAADYIASVYHYLEYEMKFSEYGKHLDSADTLSESQKAQLKTLLSEAKDKLKTLKVAEAKKQAERSGTAMNESLDMPCAECGGTGVVQREIPQHVKDKFQNYGNLLKATKAGHKRMDKNGNGIPDDLEGKEMEENFDGERGGDQDTPSKFNKQKTGPNSTRYTRKSSTFSDEHDGGDGQKSHAKSKSAAEKKKEAPALKKSKSGTWGMEGGQKFDNRDKKEESVAEGKKPDFLDLDNDGNKKEPMKKAAKDKKEKKVKESAATKMWKSIKSETEYVAERAKATKKADKDYDGDGKIETGPEEHAGAVDKAIKAAKKKETVKESADFNQFLNNVKRLVG